VGAIQGARWGSVGVWCGRYRSHGAHHGGPALDRGLWGVWLGGVNAAWRWLKRPWAPGMAKDMDVVHAGPVAIWRWTCAVGWGYAIQYFQELGALVLGEGQCHGHGVQVPA